MKNESEISKTKGHTRVQWAVAIIVNMTAFTYGLQCGWVSPMQKILQSAESPVGRPMTDYEISLVAGIPSIAAMLGILTLVFVVDIFGRKAAIMVMTSMQLLCWLIKICPVDATGLIVARVFCGLGAGGCFHVIPMYIKEISQESVRGTLGAMFILSQNIGIFIMYCLGGYVNYNKVLYIVVGVPILTLILLFKIPESPSFLVKIGEIEASTKTIALLRGLRADDQKVQAEVNLIKREDEAFKSIPHITFLNIFTVKAWRRGFIMMVVVMSLHGLNGAFSIVSYASMLLANSEIAISPELQTLSIPLFMTIGTFITMSCIQKLGRKVILGTSFGLSAVMFSTLASTILLHDRGVATPGWLPIPSIMVIVCSYGAGVSPVPFIIMSEMFNFQIRARLMACLCILAWFESFVQVVSFTAINTAFGVHVSFFVFSAINIIGVAVVMVVLPETGGKTLEEIEAMLRKEKIAIEKNFYG